MESTNIADAASLGVDATNPSNQGQRELSGEFNTKLNLEEADYSSSSEYYTTLDDSDSEEEEGAMIVDPQPPRPSTTGESRALFVANLPFNVKKSDIMEFFQEAGEVDVRFATGPDGSFRGFGHVLFASPEEAQTALGFNGRTLLGREIRLDMARIRPSVVT